MGQNILEQVEKTGLEKLFRADKTFAAESLISHRGTFNDKVIADVSNFISTELSDDIAVNDKLFRIFIELAQNIAFYSDERDNYEGEEIGVGVMALRDIGDAFVLHTANVITKPKLEPIKAKCEKVNSLDRDGLRAFKREMRNTPPGERGNAHIGLIQISLIAESPVQIYETELDADKSLTEITIEVKKN